MNATRRKEIAKAIKLLEEARELLDYVSIDEQESFDNMPEGLQMSERGQKMEENIEELDDIFTQIEDFNSRLEEI